MRRSLLLYLCLLTISISNQCYSECLINASTWLEDVQMQYSPYFEEYLFLYVDNRPLIRDYRIIAYNENNNICTTLVRTKKIVTRFLITDKTLFYTREKWFVAAHNDLISLDLSTMNEETVNNSIFSIEAFLDDCIYYTENRALYRFDMQRGITTKLFSFNEILSDYDNIFYYSTDDEMMEYNFLNQTIFKVEWAENIKYSRITIQGNKLFNKIENSILCVDSGEKKFFPISKKEKAILSDNHLYIYKPLEGCVDIYDVSNHCLLLSVKAPKDCRFAVCNTKLFFFPLTGTSSFFVMNNQNYETVSVNIPM